MFTELHREEKKEEGDRGDEEEKGGNQKEIEVRALGQEDSPGEGDGNPLQYSCLEYPMDRGAWWATVHGVIKSQTRLREGHFYEPFSFPLFCLTVTREST